MLHGTSYEVQEYTHEELQRVEAIDRCVAELNGEVDAESLLALDMENVRWVAEMRQLLAVLKDSYEAYLDTLTSSEQKETTRLRVQEEFRRLYPPQRAEIPREDQPSLRKQVGQWLEALHPQTPTPAYRQEEPVSQLTLHGEEQGITPSAMLQVELTPGAVQEYPIVKGQILIGRSPDADIQLEDPDHYISARHAEIRQEAEEWYIRDMGSTNGTEVRGERLSQGEWCEIESGETVLLAGIPVRIVVT